MSLFRGLDFRQRGRGAFSQVASFGKNTFCVHLFQAVQRAKVLALEAGFVAVEGVECARVVAEGAEGDGGAGRDVAGRRLLIGSLIVGARGLPACSIPQRRI
jgi:hypothetical protein